MILAQVNAANAAAATQTRIQNNFSYFCSFFSRFRNACTPFVTKYISGIIYPMYLQNYYGLR